MRIFKSLVSILVFFGCCNLELKAQQPNILWIIADDLSNDLGCYGNPDVKTPNIDALAAKGVRYTKNYATAPICSPSRSSLITGMYPTIINSISHRPISKLNLPTGIQTITEYFKAAGYFCTNGNSGLTGSGKTDYNFRTSGVFNGRHWNQRAEGQPFFAQVQIYEPHRNFVSDSQNPIDYKTVTLPNEYPNHPLLKADWAAYLESIQVLDRKVGNILDKLEADGLLDNTIIMFFGDHGRPHLRDKQFLYEGGLKTPLIIKWPDERNAGSINDELISLIDVSAASLGLANIDIPSHINGKDFLNDDIPEREYVFGFRQRSGDANDDMRSISDGQYKLIWNRMASTPWMQMSGYKKRQYPAYALYYYLNDKGELEAPFNQFMNASKPEIELFDLNNDPDEYTNLADDSNYSVIKDKLFTVLKDSLAVYETGWIPETTQETNQAIRTSTNSFINGMNSMGLSQNSTDEEIINWWKERYGIFDLIDIEEGHTNVAKSKPITGSSDRVGYEVAKANDEDTNSNSSRWLTASGASYPHWLEIDLEDSFELSSLRMYTGYNGYNKPINDFKLQYWSGDSWIELLNITDNNTSAFSTILDPVKTNKVRLEVTKSSNDIVRLFEIEVYGIASSLSTENFDVKQILAYPNPIKNNVLNIKEYQNINKIEVFNTLGSIINFEMKNGKVEFTNLKSGIYFLRINDNKVFKFIKE